MTLSPRIFTLKAVQRIAANVAAIIEEELITMDYTTEGNAYRNQFAVPLIELLDACDEYLSLYDPNYLAPDSSVTKPFIVN